MTTLDLRPARPDDVSALVALENATFDSDRLSRRSFLWMLTRGKAALIVAEDASGALAGYVLVLFHAGTSLARVYSLAVAAVARGQGLGERLMRAAEAAAVERQAVAMRLEVRRDNAGAIALYDRLGYRPFKVVPDYYEDHMEALRFEKVLHPTHGEGAAVDVPLFAQTTPFTCGPACLMMARAALDPDVALDARDELQVWREATSIYMASGHGGCGPLGLALAAWRRGLRAEVWLSQDGPLFTDTVRDPAKKQVIERVHEDFAAQVAETDILLHPRSADEAVLTEAMAGGGLPLVLISQYRMAREKAPHWVLLTGYDDRFFYANDPDVDEDRHLTPTDCADVPIRRADFTRMARYGKSKLRAAVVVYPRSPSGRGPRETT